MQWVFGAIEETLPIIVFFVVQDQVSFVAGVAAMCLTLLLLLMYAYLTVQAIPRFALVSTIAFMVFALPTLLTGDAWYFQLSDTVLDGMFALLLLASWYAGYPVLKLLFGSIFAITDQAWQQLALRWGLLFLILAVLNESIRQTQSIEVWSLFKLIATIGILLFGCYQFTLSAKKRIPGESNRLGLRVVQK